MYYYYHYIALRRSNFLISTYGNDIFYCVTCSHMRHYKQFTDSYLYHFPLMTLSINCILLRISYTITVIIMTLHCLIIYIYLELASE